jgi:hypothetical protein
MEARALVHTLDLLRWLLLALKKVGDCIYRMPQFDATSSTCVHHVHYKERAGAPERRRCDGWKLT